MLRKRAAKFVTVTLIMAGALVAESKKKELHFTVGPRAGVSVINPYGSISVKPSPDNTVMAKAVYTPTRWRSITTKAVTELIFPPWRDVTGRVDYEILVPADASITLHSSTGTLHAEKLHGDVSLEGPGAAVDVGTYPMLMYT